MRNGLTALCLALAVALATVPVRGAQAAELALQVSRSALLKAPKPMGEVIVADPGIADVHAHGTGYLSVIGKKIGQTTIRVFDKDRNLLQSYDVNVGYDLVAIRQALKNFLPNEVIGVEMVNTNIAISGKVSSASAVDQAVRIVNEFVGTGAGAGAGSDSGSGGLLGGLLAAATEGAPAAPAAGGGKSQVMNLLQVTSGQQVMLRVRIGEIQRDALKRLGVDLSSFSVAGARDLILGTGAGVPGFFQALDDSTQASPGSFTIADPLTDPNAPRGIAIGRWRGDDFSVGGMIRALERDGLFKLLAEPNLVAVSGEQAEFLAGGEIPVPVPQASGGSGTTTFTIEYKPFGVAVKFRPFVLSESRIRMEVQPEVSELDEANAVVLNELRVPALSTRRAKTVVELAPGESFMIAGLIKDQTRSNIDQLPGVKELPILGALFRSTEFQRNETELVIAVTPYIVDPMKSGDVRLPTDNFMPASQMEQFFYGALGSLTGNVPQISQTPSVEGPIGFMMD